MKQTLEKLDEIKIEDFIPKDKLRQLGLWTTILQSIDPPGLSLTKFFGKRGKKFKSVGFHLKNRRDLLMYVSYNESDKLKEILAGNPEEFRNLLAKSPDYKKGRNQAIPFYLLTPIGALYSLLLFDPVLNLVGLKKKLPSFTYTHPDSKGQLVTLVLTNKCTLKCKHCFEDAGPDKNDYMSEKAIDNVIEGLKALDKRDPFKYESRIIRFTGGSPELHPRLFYFAEKFKKLKRKLKISYIELESNGWWAIDNEGTKEFIKRLGKSGIGLVSVTTDDFHKESATSDDPYFNGCVQFNIYEHARRIEEICDKYPGITYKDIVTMMPFTEAFSENDLTYDDGANPIGRGRFDLEPKYWAPNADPRSCKLYIEHAKDDPMDVIHVQPNGEVFFCESGKQIKDYSLGIGNIGEISLEEMIENRFNNRVFRIITEEGIVGLANRVGMSKKEMQDMYDKFGLCGMCHEILRNYDLKI